MALPCLSHTTPRLEPLQAGEPQPNGAAHGRGLRALRVARRRHAARQVRLPPPLAARANASPFPAGPAPCWRCASSAWARQHGDSLALSRGEHARRQLCRRALVRAYMSLVCSSRRGIAGPCRTEFTQCVAVNVVRTVRGRRQGHAGKRLSAHGGCRRTALRAYARGRSRGQGP